MNATYVDADYAVATGSNYLQLMSPDGKISKRIELPAGSATLKATYTNTTGGNHYVRVGASPNVADLLGSGRDHLSTASTSSYYQVRNSQGGLVRVYPGTASRNASPADAGYENRNLALVEQIEVYGGVRVRRADRHRHVRCGRGRRRGFVRPARVRPLHGRARRGVWRIVQHTVAAARLGCRRGRGLGRFRALSAKRHGRAVAEGGHGQTGGRDQLARPMGGGLGTWRPARIIAHVSPSTPGQPLRPEHFATVLDAVSDAVLTIDRDFIITGFNRAAERLTGHRRSDVIGRHCYEVLRSNGCQTIDRCPMTLALRVGEQLGTREVAILNRANEEALVRITFTPLFGFEAEIVGGVETFRAADAPADASLPTRSAARSRKCSSARAGTGR